MAKADKTRHTKRNLLVILGVSLVVLAALFLARGWLRMTVTPTVVEAVYGNPAEKAYNQESKQLQDPLALLGYQNPSSTLNNTGCNTSLADGLSTQVICSYNFDLMLDIPSSTEAKQTLLANAEKLQALLQASGWEGEYSNDAELTSLTKLITSLNSGIDYQPDATYTKQVGDVQCMFSNNTAFSSPDTPKMSTRFYCSKSMNILGTPNY